MFTPALYLSWQLSTQSVFVYSCLRELWFSLLQQQQRGSQPLCWPTEAALAEFDSEFPLLSPAHFDKWKFLGLLSGSSPLGAPPSILTPPPHHLLLGGVKNDSREYSRYSVLDWRVEHPERVEVAFVPSGLPVNTLQLMVSLNLPPNYPALIAPS